MAGGPGGRTTRPLPITAARSTSPAGSPRRAEALDRSLDRRQSARLSPARSCAGRLDAPARQRSARGPRSRRRLALRGGRDSRRRPRFAGADPDAGADRAARGGRRSGPDLPRCSGFRRGGRRLLEAASLEALAEVDVAIVVNPNNPDGRVARASTSLICTSASRRAAAGSSSTRPSPISTASSRASRRSCRQRGRSSCARSARPTDLQDFVSDSPSPRRTLQRPCVRPWARGRSAARRSRSAGGRSPIRTGPRR